MTGASIEATLELWASSLREVKARMRPLFSQARVAASANSFLDGLLGDERRYRRRSRIEIMFGRLKDWRRVATRYDRCPTAFFSAIALAATVIFWL